MSGTKEGNWEDLILVYLCLSKYRFHVGLCYGCKYVKISWQVLFSLVFPTICYFLKIGDFAVNWKYPPPKGILMFCGVYFWHTLRNVARGLIRHARVFETPAPWDTTPPWTQLLHDESVGGEQRFHRIDIWHTFHMGFGKNWISCCVARIQYLTLGTSVDKRVEILNQDFQDYCTANKKTKYISKLEPSTFGLKFAEPSGSWNKAHVTATLMGWLESFLGKYPTECENDEEIRFIVASKYFLNTFLWFVMCNHFFSSAVFF